MARHLQQWNEAQAANEKKADPGSQGEQDAVMEEASQSLGKADGLFNVVLTAEAVDELSEAKGDDLKRKFEDMLRAGYKEHRSGQ